MSDILKKLTKEMQKVQDPKRFTHTLGVEYTAAALAMRYGEDVERAQIAGLLHDCAKCMENDKLLSACEKYHLPVTDVEKRNPYLLHARVGSYLAKKEYKIEDPEILSAILYHTTGRPGMTLLEKIIFTADYIEPGRKQAPNLTQIRHLAFTDLDAAVTKILEDTLEYLKRGGRIGGTTARLGTMLNIKPVMNMDNEGKLAAVSKARGRAAALRALVDKMGEQAIEPEKQTVFIAHADCYDDAHKVAEMVHERFGSKSLINYIGPVIGAHAGPGTVALFFVGKER